MMILQPPCVPRKSYVGKIASLPLAPPPLFLSLSLILHVASGTTRQIEISENTIIKVEAIQRPIIGGAWKTKTDFGALEIKIVPYWTGECMASSRRYAYTDTSYVSHGLVRQGGRREDGGEKVVFGEKLVRILPCPYSGNTALLSRK